MEDVPPTNTSSYSTLFGIEETGARHLCATFLLFTLFSSLIGDSIILAASTQPNGIRLNKFIVTVMQHIAVSDLMSCFSFVLPTTVMLIANRWVLKGTIDYIRLYVDTATFGANTILIALLSISKLMLLRYPSHAPRWTIKRAHITCALIWLFANIFPALYVVFDMASFKWMPKKASSIDYIAYFRIGITQVLPTLIMMVTTVLILSYLGEARRVAQHNGGRTPTRGVAAVVITVTIYCISTIPTIWAYIYTYTDRGADLDLLSWFSTCFTGLNVMCNIYVYYLTIPSLREFIRVKILQLTPLRPQPGACSSRFV